MYFAKCLRLCLVCLSYGSDSAVCSGESLGFGGERRYLRHATTALQPCGGREIQFSRLDRSEAGATSPRGAQAGPVTWREVV